MNDLPLRQIYFADLRARLGSLDFDEYGPREEIELFGAKKELRLCVLDVSAFANPSFSPWTVSAGVSIYSRQSAGVRNLLRIWESWNKVHGQESAPLSPASGPAFVCTIRLPLQRSAVRNAVHDIQDYEFAGRELNIKFGEAWRRLVEVVSDETSLAHFLETRGSALADVGKFLGQDALEHAAIIRNGLGQREAAHRLIDKYAEEQDSPSARIAVAELRAKYHAWIDATSPG